MKRLLVFSDGTWADPESETPTNIYNLATCVSHRAGDVPQLVFYDAGIGTEGSWGDRVFGGAFGKGIDLNIQQLYTHLALNYEDGDEIMLFGYSRGAYTVRSLAGMLHEAGLVTRSKLDHVHEAYELYRGDGDADRPAARKFRERHARRVPIKLLACFDTVGALGLPDGIAPRALQRKYEFHDTRLSRAVEHAVHIVSIDEDRKAFAPTLMRGREGQVRELYLPGGHGGVGGGDAAQRELARNALFVMVEECRKVCDIGMVESRLPKELVKSVPHREGSSPRREMIKFFTGQRHRNIPNVEALHSCVYERYQNVKEWRPPSLEQFASVLLKAKKK